MTRGVIAFLRAPVIDYADTFSFPDGPAELWDDVERFDRYEAWWRWLREFRAEIGGLVEGNILRGTVAPPLPIRLRLEVRLEQCERPHLIRASVGGDLRGSARVTLQPDGAGTRVDVAWSLAMVREPVRSLARVAQPLARWGHDRVVEMAVEGFRRRASSS